MGKGSASNQAVADTCPCGVGRTFAVCCGRYLDDGALPETAEALMRSRYTAYVLGREDYLFASWHVSTRPASLGLDAARRWLGLRVTHIEAGGPMDVEGWVSFVARSKRGGRADRLEERSHFVREDGRWYYVDGEIGSVPDRY
ncbi:preprotein translocase subunit SecA [Acidihalobacter yilgarnensis]|uniref:UPF0225 protein BI364_01240 n=1 Tax=Acidihalobacter yilgarnensis TaxID=2819280 RepID=A0A1D8IK10_9GAMM|nr:YchJ family metal-binding protein [Acidihalobacter yilgarnensis]AOU96810.1 preprotein translocase subunit SecA [Acidihalobacter yilgarnensis]